MSEESFFLMFSEELHESISRLTPPELESSRSKALFLSKWNSHNASSDPNGAVVACDGSLGESSFTGGLTAWVSRAMAHIYAKDGSVECIPEVAVEVNYRLEGQSLFMKALELRVLRKAIEKASREHSRILGLIDGSLYLTFFHYRERLESMAWIFEKYLNELCSLLELAGEDTVIVGLSKDSDISYLRAKILLDAILRTEGSLEVELSRGRSIKRMREKLGEVIAGAPKDTPLYEYFIELEQDISDEGLYSQIAPDPGFTTPLMLAPQTLFVTGEIKRGTKNWWKSMFRDLLEGSNRMNGVLNGLDNYFMKPPIALTYWRPKQATGVYRVDIPSNLLGHDGASGDLSEDTFRDDIGIEKTKSIVGMLNGISHEPYVVNPLTEVDAIVRLDRALYKQAYEPLIIEELRGKGFRINHRKRGLRDFVLRGY